MFHTFFVSVCGNIGSVDNAYFTQVNLCKVYPLKFLERYSNTSITEGLPQMLRFYIIFQQLQGLNVSFSDSICLLASKKAHDLILFS